MATIKRNGNLIITKGGKVSCTCCEEPGECCMYPAQAFYEGLYSAADLPDAIELTCEGGTYVLSKSGATFTDGIIVVDNYFSQVYGYATWRVQQPIFSFLGCSSEIGKCLINDTFSQDQFADSYTVTTFSEFQGVPAGNYTITRTDLCNWYSQISTTGSGVEFYFHLFYSLFAPSYHRYFLVLYWKPVGESYLNVVDIKSAPQNSPAGNYGGVFAATVS